MRYGLLLALFGCWSSSVDQLEVVPGACGVWTARIEAAGYGEQLTLEADGGAVQTWPLQGGGPFVASGRASPGSTVTFRASAGQASISKTVMFAPAQVSGRFTVPSSLPNNAVGRIQGDVDTTCASPTGRWSAKILPGSWAVQNQPLGPDGAIDLALPALEKGVYQVEVQVVTPAGMLDLPPQPLVITDPVADGDGDGFMPPEDCDDRDADVNPIAAEKSIANGKDDNCNGVIDEGTPQFDDDGDGLTEEQGDCDDDDPLRKPGAAEVPDCRDQDCDGRIDEDVTLKQKDDPQEPNDTVESAPDLNTSGQRSFSQQLRFVTRGTDDEEWFQFYSQDGTWDDWGIDVTVDQMAENAVYEVEVYTNRGAALTSERIHREGHSVAVRGKVLHDDSGQYWVRIKPVRVASWCPIAVSVVSR